MKHAARFGGMNAARRAHEKAGAEIALQLRHLLAHHGLGDAKPLGGPREGSGVHDGCEIGEAVQVHRLSPAVSHTFCMFG
jgi:hypothetical protein